jgi:hypothetical protein
MAIDNFFNHKCTIYHCEKTVEDLGYGVVNEHGFNYPDEAEEKDKEVPCHFHVKAGNYQILQSEPFNEYSARVKLSLPIDTDIRINDKIVSGETGFTYIAELPRRIQNHHVIVYVNRTGTVREAI